MIPSSPPQAIVRGFALLRTHKTAAACGFLLLLASLLALPASRAWSAWRAAAARDLCERASSLKAGGHHDECVSMMRRAYQIAPRDPSILRALAKSCDLKSRAAGTAVSFWNKLVDSGAASVDDRIELANAMLATGDIAGSQNMLRSLPQEARAQLNWAEAQAAVLREQGRDEDADVLLRSAWEAHPEDLVCRLNLARADYLSPFDASREEAGKKLWAIARSGVAQAADALLALLSGPDGSLKTVAEILQIVRENEQISTADRLRILGFCADKFPFLAGEIIAEESDRFKGRPLVNCVELYEWLSKLGQSDRILRDLGHSPSRAEHPDVPAGSGPNPAVFQSRELFLAYGDALIQKGQWRVFADLLQLPNLPISQADEELMRVLCSRGLNEPDAEVDRHLTAALMYARHQDDHATLLKVAVMAEKTGRITTAIEALSMISCPNRRLLLENQIQIYRLQTRLGDADGMMAAAEAILTIRPGLKPFAHDLQYLKLLTGTGIESVLDDLGSTATPAEGCSSGHAIIRALAAFRCGEQEASGQWAASIDSATLPTGQRAVLAGLLSKAGNEAKGARIAEKISDALLLPDERWFLQAAMR